MPRNATAFEVEGPNHPDARKAGAYWFMYRYRHDAEHIEKTDEKIGIGHACPCGCGGRGAMWFRGKAQGGGPEWEVTGEWPNVTLSPSIGFGRLETGGYHWHGYLENGVFVER